MSDEAAEFMEFVHASMLAVSLAAEFCPRFKIATMKAAKIDRADVAEEIMQAHAHLHEAIELLLGGDHESDEFSLSESGRAELGRMRQEFERIINEGS